MIESKDKTSSRILELDSLRGLAIIAVMLYHYTSRYVRLYGFHNTPPFEFWYGRLGVEFFFIISGFVIFMTLSKPKQVSISLCPVFPLISSILGFGLIYIFYSFLIFLTGKRSQWFKSGTCKLDHAA